MPASPNLPAGASSRDVVTVDTSEVDHRIANIIKELGHAGLKIVSDGITREMERVTRAAIASSRDPSDGDPWPTRKGGQSHPPLRKSGNLLDSLGFRSKPLREVAFQKTTIMPQPIKHPTDAVRTTLNLAFVHFFGAPDVGLAARPFFLSPRHQPPAWLSRRALRLAERQARKAVKG
jgi:hypothetical protein